MGLRPYQEQAIANIAAARERDVLRQLGVSATGTGKTVMFSNMPDRLGINNQTLVLVHREELADQAASKIAKWNPHRKVTIDMADRRADTNASIIVASVATLYASNFRRLDNLLKATDLGLIITDEAHHYIAERYLETVQRTLAQNEKALLVGVTATPNRSDGQAMGQLFDEIVFNYPMRQAIEEGYLADIRGFRMVTETDISGVKTQAGDFAVGALTKAINTPQRNDQIVTTWLETAWERQTVAFCSDIQHAQDLAYAFQRRGIPAEAVWGVDKDRSAKLARHRMGHTKVLCNCEVLTEGYDDWQIGCIIMAKPTKSQLKYVQMAGRGTRIQDGIDNLLTARQAGVKLDKEDCYILDVVDVTGRHSLVTLPSLFGLTPKIDLKGKSAVGAAKILEELQEKYPKLDMVQAQEKAGDIDSLAATVQAVDVWDIKWDPAVEQHSQLAWFKSYDGSYVLVLPTREKVVLHNDLLGKWHCDGSVNEKPIKAEFPDLQGAFLYAELSLSAEGKEFISLLKREAKWTKETASEPQIALLVKNCKVPLHVAKNMTKGQAAQLLRQRFAKGKGNFKPFTGYRGEVPKIPEIPLLDA